MRRPETRTTEELFAAYRELGESALFRELFERTVSRVVRTARRLGLDANAIDDVVQDTYLTALNAADRFDETASCVHWLCGIATHKALAFRRSWFRRPTGNHGIAEREAGVDPSREVERTELWRCLEVAVASLPITYREVVRPYLFEPSAPGEISRRLRRSPSTVRTQIARGLALLRHLLPDVGGQRRDRRRSAAS